MIYTPYDGLTPEETIGVVRTKDDPTDLELALAEQLSHALDTIEDLHNLVRRAA